MLALTQWTQPNILISDTGEALLCDFGLSTLIEKGENDMTTCTDIRMRCTIRFSAPELLDEESFADGDRISAPFGNRVRSKTAKSDVFAFGMVMLQVRLTWLLEIQMADELIAIQIFTGSAPWDGPDHKVILNIHAGAKPRRPGKAALQRGLSDSVWAICQWCWEYRPAYRPPMQVVTYALGAAAGPVLWTPQVSLYSSLQLRLTNILADGHSVLDRVSIVGTTRVDLATSERATLHHDVVPRLGLLHKRNCGASTPRHSLRERRQPRQAA